MICLLADLSLNLGGILHTLLIVGAVCILLWACFAIAAHFGLTVHPVVRIILIAIFSIVVLFVLGKLLLSLL